MEKEDSPTTRKAKRKSVFRFFSRKNHKKGIESRLDQNPNSDAPPASDSAVIKPGPSTEPPSTVPPVDSITSSAEAETRGKASGKDGEDVQKEEKLPASVALAKDRLNKAAEELQKKLPEDIERSTILEVEGGADINSLADDISSALVKMMEQRNVERSMEPVQGFVIEWAKKTIPFIQMGLTIVKV